MSGTTDRPIAVGVVGLGHFGRLHAEKMAEAAGAQLVAVADIDAGRAADVAATHGVEAVTDFRDLVGKVEAVSVVVPTVSHHDVARPLLEHGVHVLVEKPIAHDVDCADRTDNRGLDLTDSSRHLTVGQRNNWSCGQPGLLRPYAPFFSKAIAEGVMRAGARLRPSPPNR